MEKWLVPNFSVDGFDTLKSNIGREAWILKERFEVEPAEQPVLQ